MAGSIYLLQHHKETFARFEHPDTIINDNGMQFPNKKFLDFYAINRIDFVTTLVAHPACNGAVENAVKTFKNVLSKSLKDPANSKWSID